MLLIVLWVGLMEFGIDGFGFLGDLGVWFLLFVDSCILFIEGCLNRYMGVEFGVE